MNNKGFAITTILYGTLILFLMLLISMLGMLSTYKDRLAMLIDSNNGARDIINGNYVEEDNEVKTTGDAYALYSVSTRTLIFIRSTSSISANSYYNNELITMVFTDFEDKTFSVASDVPWYEGRHYIRSVVFEDEISPVDTSYWFDSFTACKNFDLENLNVSNVTNMTNMFNEAAGTESTVTSFSILGLEGWNTSNVTNMTNMFNNTGYNASDWALDLSEWNVEKVTSYDNFDTGTGEKITDPVWNN